MQIQQPEARVSLRFPVMTQKIHIKPHNDAIRCLVLTLPTERCDFSLIFSKLSYCQTPSLMTRGGRGRTVRDRLKQKEMAVGPSHTV